MKRTLRFWKKACSIALAAALLLSAVPACAEENETGINKLSQSLLQRLDSVQNPDELTSVYVWYRDIEEERVEEQTKAETGISLASLDEASEALGESTQMTDLTRAFLSNVKPEDALQAYLIETREERAELEEETEEYIAAKREIAVEEYELNYQEVNQRMQLPEERIIFKSRYAPMVIVDLTKEEIEELSRCADVGSIELFEDGEMQSESILRSDVETEINKTLCSVYKTISSNTGLTGKGAKVGILEEGDPSEFSNPGGTLNHWDVHGGCLIHMTMA